MPKVSVIIPTYNRPELLRVALASVYAQTFTDYEVIVIDDGSSPRAFEALLEYRERKNFRYYETEKNAGGGKARNMGIREAKGEYIAFLDDDDSWAPEKLSVQVPMLDALPEDVGFSFTGAWIARDGTQYVTHVADGVHDFSLQALTDFNGFLTVTQVMRTKAIREISGFDETLPSHQEAEMIIRLTQRGYRGLAIDMPLTHVNADSARASVGRSLLRRVEGRTMLLAKHNDIYAQHPHALARSYFEIGIWYRTMQDFGKAHDYMVKAYRLRPTSARYFLHMLHTFVRKLYL